LAVAVREPLENTATERWQRERESMKTSIAIGALALAAIAGSANAAIVTGPGIGTDCLTMEGSTSTTITYFGYTDGSWAGNLRRFSIGVYLTSPVGQPAAAYATHVSLIEYSMNAGSSWATYNMGSPNTLLDPDYGFGALPMGPAVSFGFPGLSPVGIGNFRVRVTLDANPAELIDGRRVLTVLSYSTSFGGGQNSRSSLVVPTPGAAAVLGLGGLLAARRRR
jgi:hypothetical protein